MSREEMLVGLTYQYVNSFRTKEYETLSELLDDDVNHIEPNVNIRGKSSVIDFIRKMHDTVDINFVATRIFASEEDFVSIIEFDVDVQTNEKTQTFRGTDHLQWNREGKIEKIEAFLYEV